MTAFLAFLAFTGAGFVALMGLTHNATILRCQPCRLAILMLASITNATLVFGVFFLLGAFA